MHILPCMLAEMSYDTISPLAFQHAAARDGERWQEGISVQIRCFHTLSCGVIFEQSFPSTSHEVLRERARMPTMPPARGDIGQRVIYQADEWCYFRARLILIDA